MMPRPEPLSELTAHLPATWVSLGQLCLAYNIRVLPDHSVILPDGRQMPCEKALPWLRMQVVP